MDISNSYIEYSVKMDNSDKAPSTHHLNIAEAYALVFLDSNTTPGYTTLLSPALDCGDKRLCLAQLRVSMAIAPSPQPLAGAVDCRWHNKHYISPQLYSTGLIISCGLATVTTHTIHE